MPNGSPQNLVPHHFQEWFAAQGWRIRDFQTDMVKAFTARKDTLLMAPTGGGKTLAGFLPSLIDIARLNRAEPTQKVHTLYISPLRALTNDIERNLRRPVEELGLDVTIGSRTGDTKQYQRQKLRTHPPDILLTTPESLWLLLSYPDAADYFSDLRLVIIDELHSFATGKRGDFTCLALARLKSLAPDHTRFGFSATIADPAGAANWLGPTQAPAQVIQVKSKIPPDMSIMVPDLALPLGGHSARHAVKDIYARIKSANMTIVFVNTRAQAELLFQQLWTVNTDSLPIGIYHGSLSREKRQQAEELVSAGKIKAIVSTSALEMGIDWGDVDEVIQIGAPKGVSRLLQRIGRSNHRMDEPSQACLVPSNPFEAIECQSAIEAIQDGERDGEAFVSGARDVIVQYLVNKSCEDPMEAAATWQEIRTAYPYRNLSRADFDRLLAVAEDGGYALKTYERFKRVKQTPEGYRIADQQQARRHRMNVGTIVEYAKLKVHRFANQTTKRYRKVGEIEERFVVNLSSGDTFMFGGEVLRFHGVREMAVEASPIKNRVRPMVPSYAGGMMPLSTYLSGRVRTYMASPQNWTALPAQVQSWLKLQSELSDLPPASGLFVESFFARRDQLEASVFYTFEGRKVNQALGLLLTRRMEAMKLAPVAFSITDYTLCITSLRPIEQVDALLGPDIISDTFEAWISDSNMVKRCFRKIATIAGLTEQRMPGQRRTMKSLTFSTDLIYDVLQKYEPDHVLLEIAREEAERDLIDLDRLKNWLALIQGQIFHRRLDVPSPLSIPALMQMGKERIDGEAQFEALDMVDYGDRLLEDAKRHADHP